MSRGILFVSALFLTSACAGSVADEPAALRDTPSESLPVTTSGDVLVSTTTSVVEATSSTLETISSPAGAPYLGVETGVLLLVDDGIDGLTAVDLDHRLSGRSVVEGQRAGDEQYSMVKVGNHLIVGWGEPYSVDLTTRDGMSLGAATIFVPAAEPNAVWMVDYPGGRIGMGDPHVWQVDVVSGERLTEPKEISKDTYPDLGIVGGLALQKDTGFSIWNAETDEITPLESDGPGFSLDVQGDELVWCASDCRRLLVTDTSNMQSETFDPPDGQNRFFTAELSPDGQTLAAIVGLSGNYEGIGLWILDRATNKGITDRRARQPCRGTRLGTRRRSAVCHVLLVWRGQHCGVAIPAR
jgi:hypothetical protein